MREKKTSFQWVIAMLIVAGFAVNGYAQQKPRIAVVDFNDKDVRGEVRKELKKEFDVGRHVADMLITKLVDGNIYSVIERNEEVFKLIIKEQDMGESNRLDKSTAAQAGKMKGTDIYVIGKITSYGKAAKKGLLGKVTDSVQDVFKKEKAVVGLSFRMVDATTGEVLQTGEVKGESKGDKINTDKMITATKKPTNPADNEEAANIFAKSIFGEATLDAVGNLAVLLEKKVIERAGTASGGDEKAAPQPVKETGAPQKSLDTPTGAASPAPAPQVANKATTPETVPGKIGIVADVSGLNITIKLEQPDRVRVGDRVRIRRVKKEIKDPDDPQKVLDYDYAELGLAQVSEVREKIIIAKFMGRALVVIRVKDLVFVMP